MALKRTLPELVGRVNRLAHSTGEGLMLMGPGRWGSSSLELGIGVGYAQINHAHVLVEIAQETAGLSPDFSYGTHFFQDLVEDEILYLAVNPDLPSSGFNAAFFGRAHNALLELFPDAAAYADLVRLIDVPAACGARAAVVVDLEARAGVCYLE